MPIRQGRCVSLALPQLLGVMRQLRVEQIRVYAEMPCVPCVAILPVLGERGFSWKV